MAKLLSPKRDEQYFRYLLGGLRLLHTLCDLAPRYSKLEQVLLDDVHVSEQMLDLIFYMIIFLSGLRQKILASSPTALLHSASLASSLYLLPACISSKWHELTHVLLAHPKVDAFTSVAFPALRAVISFLQVKLSAQHTDAHVMPNVDEVRRLGQHCEASLQFLLSLCQQKLFRERLVMNKDLCEEGGALLLVQDIMKLPPCDDSHLMAVVSRLKSKVLSIMLHLCETEVERGSFLDLAASTTGGLDLAKSIVFQVLEVLKIMFSGDPNGPSACSFKGHPRGLLQLNAMRLTEIFSDDSNFRSYIVLNFTEVLTTVFLLPHGEFLSSWCSSALEPCEEDVIIDYDSLSAAGQALGVFSTSHVIQSAVRTRRAPRTPYARQKTSLLVKIVANLTCFVPDICKEEEGLFVNKFLQCLQKELPRLPDGVVHTGGAERTAAACRNLHSLLHHAESLREYLNEDDVQLLRLFIRKLEGRITPQESNIHHVKEIQSRGQCSSPAPERFSPEGRDKSGNQDAIVDQLHQLNFNGENRSNDVAIEDQRTGVAESSAAKGVQESDRDAQNIETNGPDSPTLRLKNSVDRMNNVEGIPEDQIVRSLQSEEKQLKKRKRNIMNDVQITIIENALRDEPDMQRKAASIQFWADKLSLHGSEVTSSQLKNWLNNRKAKLARAAVKDVHVPSAGDDAFPDKQVGSGTDPVSDSPESPVDEFVDPSPLAPQGTHQKDVRGTVLRICGNENSETIPTSSFRREHGQYVMLTNEQGEEIGKGNIHLPNGIWFGKNLEESG
ncbi:hypothetical protein L6452_43300 [Arctium lappa]|uniref:Uncharacterized protein n=1 Tax=Arctium lappa TaxID=4217 RepID=A0ACB8XLF3_ARCLA|nr:hypothetical protein L6452_43300 [Arctium lappa]